MQPVTGAFTSVPLLPSRTSTSRLSCATAPRRPTRWYALDAAAASTAKLFDGLSHINRNLRVKAAAEIARLPPSDTVPHLLGLLSVQETAHRRAAVQALGMVGPPAVPAIVDVFRDASDITVRASCAKALAAVAMYFPLQCADFDDGALDLMEAFLTDGVDPVTKIATVGCLVTLACDAKVVVAAEGAGDDGAVETRVVAKSEVDAGAEGVVLAAGNERAVQLLMHLLQSSEDVALRATVAGAVAQIANCGGEDRKKEAIRCLRAVAGSAPPAADDGEDTGFGYIQEMCLNHVGQLEGRNP
jgi:bilin biosynthesis protein